MKSMLRNFLFLVVFCIFTTPAFAIVIGPPIPMVRTSDVTTVVTESQGIYTYNFTVINTSSAGYFLNDQGLNVWPLIVDYEIPLTHLSDIYDILSPDYWAYEILSDQEYFSRYGEENPFDSSYILHWHDSAISWDEGLGEYSGIAAHPIAPPGYTAGFGGSAYEDRINGFVFSSQISPVAGPYASSWQDAARYIADPPLPGGNVGGGGTIFYQPQNTPVPEPSTILLLASGLAGLAFYTRKRKNV